MSEVKSGIYRIRNIVSGKFYIGSSINILKRWSQHMTDLKRNVHDNDYLQKSWNKHGEDNFEFEIVETLETNGLNSEEIKESIIRTEQKWLDSTDCCNRSVGYNLAPTAGSCLGYKMTEEQRRRVGAASKGRYPSEETKKKISESLKGRVFSQETIEKMRIAGKRNSGVDHPAYGKPGTMLGKKHTDSTKKKMSDTQKNKVVSDETKRRMSVSGKKRFADLGRHYLAKTVEMIDLETLEVTKEYPSLVSVESDGFSKACVGGCCRGVQKIHGGYMWRFKDE